MKTKKRIAFLTLICCLATCFYMPTASVSADSAEKNAYSEGYTLINGLNPIEDLLDGDGVLSRGEFISSVVRIMNYDYTADTKLDFDDVEEGEALYNVLSLAVCEGLVSNSESFRPGDAATYSEIMAVAVRALGYERLAGEYPQGYHILAQKLDLDKGISYSGITEDDIYIILYNMLNTKTLSETYELSLGGVNVSIDAVNSVDEKTLLERGYDVYCIEGIMTANNYTKAASRNDGGENKRITVGGVSLKSLKFNEYLGYNVKAYYQKETEEAVLIYPYCTNEVVLTADILDDAVKEGKTLKFTTEYNTKYYTEESFEVILNGKFDYSYKAEEFKDFAGFVTLIDNDRNGRYDVVKLDKYEYIYDARVNKFDEAIYDNKNSKTAIRIFESDADIYIFDYSSKEQKDISDIAEGASLAVKNSRDKKLIEVYILTDTVSGVVESYNSQSKKIKIGGKEYVVSKNFTDRYAASALFRGAMSFKLGVNNDIIEISDAAESFGYGYLMGTSYDEFKGEGAVKLFTSDGKTEQFEIGEKLTLDGISGSGKAVKSVSNYKLVRYMLNSNGMLIKLDTPEVVSAAQANFVDPIAKDGDNSLTSFEKLGASFYYRASTSTFMPTTDNGNSFCFRTTGAVIFAVPVNETLVDDYYIAQSGEFTNATYNVTAYDVSPEGSAGAIIYKYDSSSIATAIENEAVIVVEEVANAINSENEKKLLLTGWSEGKFVEYFMDPEIKIEKKSGLNSLYPGDIIRFKARDGEIKSLLVQFDAHPKTFAKNDVTGVSAFNGTATGYHFQSGKAYSKADGYIYLAREKDSDGNWLYGIGNLGLFYIKPATVLVVDCENGNRLRPGTVDDIVTYCENGDESDFVVLKQQTYYTKNVIIYKGAAK